jgi:hypothetical protein
LICAASNRQILRANIHYASFSFQFFSLTVQDGLVGVNLPFVVPLD